MSKTIRSKVGVITYLAPSGPVDSVEELASLREVAEECIAAKDGNIVIDFSRVPLVTGAVLDCLLDIQSSISKMGGGLKIMNPNAVIMDVFIITGFIDYIEVLEGT